MTRRLDRVTFEQLAAEDDQLQEADRLLRDAAARAAAVVRSLSTPSDVRNQAGVVALLVEAPDTALMPAAFDLLHVTERASRDRLSWMTQDAFVALQTLAEQWEAYRREARRVDLTARKANDEQQGRNR